MKKSAQFILIAIGSFISLQSAYTESVAGISETHFTALIEDLQRYMESHPEAEDMTDARQLALEASMIIGHPAVLDLLKTNFELLKNQKPLSTNDLLRTGLMLSKFAIQFEKYDTAKYVQTEFESLAKSTGEQAFAQFADVVEGDLNIPRAGDKVELSGFTIEDKDLKLSDYRGKLVLLNFWATWCGPCIVKVPILKEWHAQYADKGFEIIGISGDQSLVPLETYVDLNNLNWPNIFDMEQEESILEQFSVTKFPTTFLLDGEGKVIATNPDDKLIQAKLNEL